MTDEEKQRINKMKELLKKIKRFIDRIVVEDFGLLLGLGTGFIIGYVIATLGG